VSLSNKPVRLEQLQAFLAVAQTGSFQKAARLCHVTQSTISRQIQALESEVGLSLFHRADRAKLTIGGTQLLPHATKICREWENALQELSDLVSGKQTELCVAAIHSVCAHYLPPVLQKFCQQRPEVQLRVTALGSDRALKVLRDGLVDIAIVMNNPMLTNSSEMAIEVLYNESIEVLMAANHPLSEYTAVPWLELCRYNHVVFKDGYGMQRLVQDIFSKQGKTLNAVLELNTLDAFRGVVRQGNLISILPHSALLEAQNDPTLAVRAIEADAATAPALQRQVILVTTHDRLKVPTIYEFYRLVQEQILVNS
jgi:DNA-binding transcriptional LysR family regulator